MKERPAAAAPASAPRSRLAVPNLDISLPPLEGVVHATRLARAAAMPVQEECKGEAVSSGSQELLVGDASISEAEPSLIPPAPIVSLLTQESHSSSSGDTQRSTGSELLRREEIWTALRQAMHLVGDPAVQPPKAHRVALADRYLATRILVDQYTAHGVLQHAFLHEKVAIVRGFPGRVKPPYGSARELRSGALAEESMVYAYNQSGSKFHYILKTGPDGSLQTRTGLAWWQPINQLHDRPILDDISGRTIWTFISRRGGSPLHLDSADGTCTQVSGRKLWVFVDKAEAKAHGIEQVECDPMRENPAGTQRFTAWLACLSFQWTILEEGETIVLPQSRLHGVHTIGDEESVSCGTYCWLAGTSPPAGVQPPSRPKPPPPQPHRPVPSTPLQPLPVVQRAIEAAPSSHLPLLARAAAVVLHDDGQSTAAAAVKAGTSERTVQRWSKRLRESDSLEDAPRAGRPRCTDEALDTAIVGYSMVDPFLPPLQLQAHLGLEDISDDTVARRLDEAGLHARIAHRQFILKPEHREKRLRFAEGYKNWTEEQWCRVLFADEKMFWGEGHSGRQYVRRPDGTADDEQYWVNLKPHPVSVPAWACFSAKGPGYMAMYEGSADARRMASFYRDYLVPTAKEHLGIGQSTRWLLHDNDARHKAPATLKVLHDNAIEVLDFPPYSPDLNPIENLWTDVTKRMRGKPAASKAQLEELLQQTWGETDPSVCEKLARSMPKRLAECIERHGAYTGH